MCQPTWKLWILKEKRFSITTGWNYSKCWQISGGVFSSLAKVFPQVVLLLLPGKSPEVSHHNNNEGWVTSARYKDMKLSKANFDNILLHMDSAVVGVWLKRANDSVKILASWPYDGRWQLCSMCTFLVVLNAHFQAKTTYRYRIFNFHGRIRIFIWCRP